MSAPEAPDPAKTAAAQSASNKETAIAQAGLNMTNQKTPYGSLNYKQIGTWSDGTPRYEAEQTLTPDLQTAVGNMQGTAAALSGQAKNTLSKPIDLSNENITDYIYNLGKGQRDQAYGQASGSLETALMNKGLRPGSAAYDREMNNLRQQQADAENNYLLNARGQAVGEIEKQYYSPVNTISALMSGSQVNPGFTQTPQTGVNGTDVAGITQNAYNTQMQGYQSNMGGLLGLGTAMGGWMFSDRRLKSNVRRLRTHPLGIGVYEYDIAGARQRGVMADEVAQVMPSAVRERGGFLQVNYDMIGGV